MLKTEKGSGNRYDFQFNDQEGYKINNEGFFRSFNKEYWNYAKLISGVLRHGMPLPYVVDLVSGLNHDDAQLHSWANGVKRALSLMAPQSK